MKDLAFIALLIINAAIAGAVGFFYAKNRYKKKAPTVKRVANRDRRLGSALSYLHVSVANEHGELEEWLLTDHEATTVRQRADMNREDLPTL